MTEKLGRKALFIDVCEDEGVKNEDQIDSGESIREDIQDLLEQGTQGNFSGRIDEEPADPVWKPVISKIHHLYGKLENDEKLNRNKSIILENYPSSVIVIDKSHQILFSNHAYDELVQSFQDSDIPFDDGIPGAPLIREEEFDAVLDTRKQLTSEVKIITGNDTEQYIEKSGSPIVDENDEVTSVLFILQDITPRLKTEKELTQQLIHGNDLQLMNDSFFQNNPLPLIILNSDFQIVQANNAFAKLCGIDPEMIVSMNYSDFGVQKKNDQGLYEICNENSFGDAEVIIDFPTGRHILRQYDIPIAMEKIGQHIFMFYDITQQIDRVEELQEEVNKMINICNFEETTQIQVPIENSDITPTSTEMSAEIEIPKKSEDSRTESASIPNQKISPAKTKTIEIVEFKLGTERYAININIVREIVEMMTITSIPRSPEYLRGIMNLRGEITNILNIYKVLDIPEESAESSKKIIVLASEATGGENIGVIVDDVYNVMQVLETDVEYLDTEVSSESGSYIKGIIKTTAKAASEQTGEKDDEKSLIIWIDLLKVLLDLTERNN
ncbi:MAG: chemotaxis protein CheW [Clostridia bacterium]|nr:chemotaxis protein CheW [Clostridia bacterium]